MLLERASRTIHDRPRVGTASSSSFRKNIGFGGAALLQRVIKFQDLRPLGGGLAYYNRKTLNRAHDFRHFFSISRALVDAIQFFTLLENVKIGSPCDVPFFF